MVTGISPRWIRLSKTTGTRISPSGSRYRWPSWKTVSNAGSDAVYCAGTYPVAAVGAGEDTARAPLVVDDRPPRNAWLAKGVRAVRIANGHGEVGRLTNVRDFGHRIAAGS